MQEVRVHLGQQRLVTRRFECGRGTTRQFVNYFEAHIVTTAFIFAAWVADTNDECGEWSSASLRSRRATK